MTTEPRSGLRARNCAASRATTGCDRPIAEPVAGSLHWAARCSIPLLNSIGSRVDAVGRASGLHGCAKASKHDKPITAASQLNEFSLESLRETTRSLSAFVGTRSDAVLLASAVARSRRRLARSGKRRVSGSVCPAADECSGSAPDRPNDPRSFFVSRSWTGSR